MIAMFTEYSGMESYPVSRLVNSPANGSKEVIERVGE
jgi:hypothetical protein